VALTIRAESGRLGGEGMRSPTDRREADRAVVTVPRLWLQSVNRVPYRENCRAELGVRSSPGPSEDSSVQLGYSAGEVQVRGTRCVYGPRYRQVPHPSAWNP
jgi:hypothetical protein